MRGTIQGDSLSSFLFLPFIDPLPRWLKVGDRGYRCGSMPAAVHLILNAYEIYWRDRQHIC